MNKTPEHSNTLSKESSPYLLQHAQNPVDWKPWNDQTKEEAKKAGKPILFSIGYAACHWCHVMEHESFEDEEVAAYMNKHFTCVKVDREERPDVDALYMDAVQLITGQGGWPLHAFTFPDGQPFYGGTYFPKERWLNVLGRINQAYTNDYDDLKSYADKLAEGLKVMNVFEVPEGEPEFRREQLDVGVSRWSGQFDPKHGGHGKAPKFPMPDNYLFLLEYATVSGNPACLNQVNNTLTSMALSGLYDTVGGGFARYSTDERWHVPHFEKMLYDNAQLIRLYADAYRATGNKLYLKTAQDTYGFCHSELSAGYGFYFSSLDADTEGEEGKYYVWTAHELKDTWKENSEVLFDYFQIDKASFWEQGKNVLMPVHDDSSIREQYNLTPSQLETLVSTALNQLNAVRDERVKPGLDDKSLTSWNALMLTGLCALYKAKPKDDYLHEAEKIASFIWSVQLDTGNELFHSFKEDKSSIPGFLEDYCFAIEAFISLYEISFNEIYLNQANDLLIRCQTAFQDSNSGLFFMTPIEQPVAVTRKIEFMDNVIPSGNSTMALCLYKLGRLLDNPDYVKQAESMLHKMEVDLSKHITNYSSWGRLLLYMTMPKSEVVFTGERVKDNLEHFHSSYRPGTLVAGHQELSNLPLLKNRYVKGKSFMYVCVNSVCELPLENPEDIIGRLPSFG